jgi:ribulose-phosphate 3-epimerase
VSLPQPLLIEVPVAIVAPSILSADFGRLADEIQDVIARGADWIHVDVMDGRFVPNLTLGPVIVEAVKRAAGSVPVDVHLMILEPERYVRAFRDAGADRIAVHPEAGLHLQRTLALIRESGAAAGVALNPDTHESVLDYVWDDLDQVLVMTVNPGFGGQRLIEATLRKVARIRQIVDGLGRDVMIEVDGGVKPDNAGRFTAAGARALVSGSGVFGAADRSAAIAALKQA